MGRVWTPVQTAPDPSSVTGLSAMGERVLQALRQNAIFIRTSCSVPCTRKGETNKESAKMYNFQLPPMRNLQTQRLFQPLSTTCRRYLPSQHTQSIGNDIIDSGGKTSAGSFTDSCSVYDIMPNEPQLLNKTGEIPTLNILRTTDTEGCGDKGTRFEQRAIVQTSTRSLSEEFELPFECERSCNTRSVQREFAQHHQRQRVREEAKENEHSKRFSRSLYNCQMDADITNTSAITQGRSLTFLCSPPISSELCYNSPEMSHLGHWNTGNSRKTNTDLNSTIRYPSATSMLNIATYKKGDAAIDNMKTNDDTSMENGSLTGQKEVHSTCTNKTCFSELEIFGAEIVSKKDRIIQHGNVTDFRNFNTHKTDNKKHLLPPKGKCRDFHHGRRAAKFQNILSNKNGVVESRTTASQNNSCSEGMVSQDMFETTLCGNDKQLSELCQIGSISHNKIDEALQSNTSIPVNKILGEKSSKNIHLKQRGIPRAAKSCSYTQINTSCVIQKNGNETLKSNATKKTALKIPEMFQNIKKRKVDDLSKMESTMDKTTALTSTSSTRKTKFQAPFKKKSLQDKQDLKEAKEITEDVNIISLTTDSLHSITSQVEDDSLLEVGLTLLYREGFSQLNKPSELSKWAHCTPSGLMLSVTLQSGNTQFYYLCASSSNIVPQNFLSLLLRSRCRKLCYGAQELISFLIDNYGFTNKQECLKWILLDPKVGCWLLDPDHPPNLFSEAVTMLQLNKGVPTGSSNLKVATCRLMKLLSSMMEKLYQKLQEQGLWKLFLDMEMRLLPIIAVMELGGVCVNKEKLTEMEGILQEEVVKAQNAAYEAAGKRFQLNSVQQLSRVLYEDLKLDQKASIVVKATMSRKVKSTSIPVMTLLQPFHPLPAIVLEYRHLQKLKSTYVDGILQHIKENYIFTCWEQTAAATGRITCSNPNLQSIPKLPLLLNGQKSVLLRSPFVPRPGHIFLGADFKHIEFRMFAHLAKDVGLQQIFHKPGDIFLTLAQMWLGKTGDTVTTEDREKTKRIVYAVMYGAGAKKLAEILKVKAEEVNHIIKSFTSICPVLHKFRQQVIDQCRKQGYLCSIAGRRRLFPNICSPNLVIRAHAERQAINFVIQGSAADICKSAILHTEHMLQQHHLDGDAHLVLQIHDELLWEVATAQLPCVRDVVKTAMENDKCFGFTENFSIPLPVVISVGKTWAEMTP